MAFSVPCSIKFKVWEKKRVVQDQADYQMRGGRFPVVCGLLMALVFALGFIEQQVLEATDKGDHHRARSGERALETDASGAAEHTQFTAAKKRRRRRNEAPSINPLQPGDLFRLARLGQVAFSPTSEWVAYELIRPARIGPVRRLAVYYPELHSDVWLAHTATGACRNLTSGATTNGGYFLPIWSPDAKRLAMLCVRDGRIFPVIRDLNSNEDEILSDLNVKYRDLYTAGAPFIRWISNDKMICLCWPGDDGPSILRVETRHGEFISREWQKSWSGDQPTANVFNSGEPIDLAGHPAHQSQLVLVDVARKSRRTLATGQIYGCTLSPSRRYLTFFKQTDQSIPSVVEATLQEDAVVRMVLGGSQVYVVRLDDEPDVRVVDGIEEVLPEVAWEGVLTQRMHWSADGSAFAFLARVSHGPEAGENATRSLVLVEPRTGRGNALQFDEAEIEAFIWAGPHRLMARLRPPASSGARLSRGDWWLLDNEKPVRNVTGHFDEVPQTLISVRSTGSLVALADEAVWRIADEDGGVRRLTAEGIAVESLVWPPEGQRRSDGGDVIVARGERRGERAFLAVDLSSDDRPPATALSSYPPGAEFRQLAPNGRTAAVIADDADGLRLWLDELGKAENKKTIVDANQWLRKVTRPEVRRIHYESLRGERLSGWLVLPVGYEEGQRVPLISEVYGGMVYQSERSSRSFTTTFPNPYSIQFLASHGYAVLLPSMPLKPMGQASDPLLDLTNGVLPAIDKVIEMGIADSNQLGLFGVSYGGYCALGLMTQTDRFGAAVVICPVASNLVSSYNSFVSAARHISYAHPYYVTLGHMQYFETGWGRLGAPPWVDPERYHRNSPLTHVARVKTPVLMIHGDADQWPHTQSEEFFNALMRQGKRARLVRYAGEGHGIEGRANVIDLWNRIYKWYDEFFE